MDEVLNVDCLNIVHSYLLPQDVRNLEKAYLHWKAYTTSYWKTLKKLDIAFLPVKTLSRMKEMEKIRTPKTKWLFQRYNVNTWKCLDERTVVLSKLTAKCRKLRIIHITSDVKDSDLCQLFANNPEIQHVALNFNTVLTGSCLEKLPITIRKLELCGDVKLNRNLLLDFIKKCNLQSLKIELECCDLNFVKDLLIVAPGLQEFTLLKSSRTSIDYITDFKQLKRLGLRDISNEVIDVLVLGCQQIEVLELHTKDEYYETPASFHSLALKLTKLRHLILGDTYLAGKKYLSDFIKTAQLEILEVYSCRRFTDEVAKTVLEYSPNLHRLELNRCAITEDLILIAVTELRKQSDRKMPLDLIIKNIKLNAEMVFKHSHELLRLVYEPPRC